MKHVLILDGMIHPSMYRPTEHWRRLMPGIPCDSVHLPTGGRVPALGRYSHLIVTGSEASILCPEPWYEVEAAAIREAVDRGLSVLGSCFGHQMLARALSGPEHVGAAPEPEMGWVTLRRRAADPLLDDLPASFCCFVLHFDEVCAPPPQPWRVLADSAGCGVQAMRYGDRPVWGLQAHPEIPPDEARGILAGFLELQPGQASRIRPLLEGPAEDDCVAGKIVGRFLEL